MQVLLRAATLAVLDVKPPSLVIGAIGTRNDFHVLLLTRTPSLDIVFLGSNGSYIASADVDNAVRYLQFFEYFFCILAQLFVKLPRLFRCAEHKLFNLIELVYSVKAFCIDTLGSYLPAEARAYACELDGRCF